LKLIGEGFRSIAIEADGQYIVLIGKHSKSSEAFLQDKVILPQIADLLPCEIPTPQYFIESSEAFPFGVLCYPKIDGITLTKELIRKTNLPILALDIANFLVALHGLDARLFGLEHPDLFEEDQKLKKDVLPTLKRILSTSEQTLVVEWWKVYQEGEENFMFEPSLIHGDLWYENFLLEKDLQHLVGIIDFEACRLGDPASDFAPLYYLGSDFLEAVFSDYASKREVDLAAFRKRIQRHWEKREFGGIRYSIQNNDESELHDSIKKIRRGPILNGAFERELLS
jgi:aminoglycoside phosphotransferase (APT) family kinase protein